MTISSDRRKLQRTKRFARDIKKMSQTIQKEAYEISQKLSENIFTPQLNIRRLIGFENIYRVVVKNDYPMIFSFDSENLYLLRIGHRKDIYRNLEL